MEDTKVVIFVREEAEEGTNKCMVCAFDNSGCIEDCDDEQGYWGVADGQA